MDAAGRGTVFPMPQIPALLFPPPSPPPPPPVPSYSFTSPAAAHHAPTITSFPILVLTVLGILITSLLLLAYYVFVIRCCLNWHGSSSDAAGLFISRRHRRNAQQASTTGSSRRFPASAAPAEARGLDDGVIQALPAFRYRKAAKNPAAADDAAPTAECPVCLGEFEEGETVRMLPACLHAFHVDCIDTWLQGNANCPLCRAAITTHCLLPPPLLDLDHQQQPDEVVIQVAPAATQQQQQEEDRGARAQQQEPSAPYMAAAQAAGHTTTTGTADQQLVSVSSDKRQRKSNNAWHDIDISSHEDECVEVRKDRDVLPFPLRRSRSFSMGSLAAGEVHLHIHSILHRNTQVHNHDVDDSGSGSSIV